jgi:ElaB/YqjD/DUF883 family membrane-anchored ribosome-binding protein
MAEENNAASASRLEGAAERAHGLIDQARDGAAATAERAARSVHRRIDQAATGATAAADWMAQKTQSYRETPQAMVESACETIRARPLVSVGVALAAGYLIGRIAR